MNANLKQRTPVQISDWLEIATKKLKEAEVASPQLDAELLLAHTLGKPRTYLHTNYHDSIDNDTVALADKILMRRIQREPMAYILGSKEFYKRDFTVTHDTLIPRPETEQLVEKLIEMVTSRNKPLSILDVGTGSGCIGLTLKLELPNSAVTLLDISDKALDIAKLNAKKLNADASFMQSDLLQNVDQTYDIIVANLPYVSPGWQVSPEVKYEPSLALYADNEGLVCIKNLIKQTPGRLNGNGILALEADPKQHQLIIGYATKYRFKPLHTGDFYMCLTKD